MEHGLAPATDGAQGDAATQRVPAARPDRVQRLRRALLDAPYTLCTRKAELLTEWFAANRPARPWVRRLAERHFAAQRAAMERQLGQGAPQSRLALAASNALQRLYLAADRRVRREPIVVDFARALAHVLDHMELVVWDDELIVGNLSSARIGAPIHPDFGGMLLLPELDRLASRPVNALRTTPEQIRRLREEIFPCWFPRSVLARAPLLARDPELANTLLAGRDFVLTQFAGISHVTPDYASVLRCGFLGIAEDIDAALAQARTAEQRAFLQAGAIAARAAARYGQRWRRHLLLAAARTDDNERAIELRQLASIFAQVPARPARTFHEALQSLFCAHVIVHQESFQHGVSFGRIDQYLDPFYQADLAAGRITPARAEELLACFLGKAAEQLPLFNSMATEFFSGLSSASGLTLAGRKADGTDATNETTYLILAAYDRMRLRQPNLHLRVHEGSPRRLLDAAFAVLKKGGGMPAFFADEHVERAITSLGVAPEHARDYAVVGCVEWGVAGRSFPAAGAGFVSLAAVLDDVLHGRLRATREAGAVGGGGDTVVFADMESLMAALEEGIEQRVATAVDGNNAIEEAHKRWRPTPLLSCLVDGCIERGLDVTAGGARYNSSGLQGVGLADVADSLAAIEQMVYVERRMRLRDLLREVDDDFAHNEPLRARLAWRVAHYGADSGRAEHWAARVAEAWCAAVGAHSNPRGGPYAPGFWSMTTHIGFGRRLGALPSGRRATMALADGLSPANGADRRGPTASLGAAARVARFDRSSVGGRGACCGLVRTRIANGYALNEKLDPCLVAGERGNRILEGLTRGYFAAGGMQVQYNIVDAAELLDARAHPERHRDLVVRISGYSAYFNDLTDEMKDDIIARTLHGAANDRSGSGPACQDSPATLRRAPS